jgi:hypothetical protein
MNNQPRTGQRSLTFMALYSALWTFLAFMFTLQLNNYSHSSPNFRITWLIVGLSFGVLFSTVITHSQLKKLDEKGEDPTTLKTILIIIGAAIVAVAAILEVASSNLPIGVQSALGYSIFAGSPAVFISRTLLMVYWERQKRTRIFQDKYGLYISRNNPINNSESQTASNAFQSGSKVGLT